MTEFLRRKSQAAPGLDGPFQNPVCLCLLRVMFGNPADGDTQVLDDAGVQWQGGDYSIKEFSAYINRSPWAVYKWLDPDAVAQFPVQYFFDFVSFVSVKSNKVDDRLAAYVAEIAGYADKVRAITEIIKGR